MKLNRFLLRSMLAIAATLFFVACGDKPDMTMFDNTNNGATDQVDNVVDQPATVTPTEVPATATPTAAPVVYLDEDGDGYSTKVDCNDDPKKGGAAVHPNATETCDGIDNNCDDQTDEGLTAKMYVDKDHDGYGLASEATIVCINAPSLKDYAQHDGDCNDSTEDLNADGMYDGYSINPTATETCDDGVDDNCDGNVDEGCAPPAVDPKPTFQIPDFDGADVYLMIIAPADKQGLTLTTQSVFNILKIGMDWQTISVSNTNVVMVKIDPKDVGVRFNTSHAENEWFCMGNGATAELNKTYQVFLVSQSNFAIDVTSFVEPWSDPKGKDFGCSGFLQYNPDEGDCSGNCE